MFTLCNVTMRVFVTILFLACAFVGSKCTYQADLDTRAAEYAHQVESETGQSVKWWDMYRQHSEMYDRPEYEQYQITVQSLGTYYEAATSDYTGPGWNFTQWFHNGGSEPITSVFTKSTEFTDQYSWTVTNSMRVQRSVDIYVGVPNYFSTSYAYSTSFAIDSVDTHTTTRTDTYSVQNTLTVPAQRSLKVEFIITEHTIEAPWVAEIEITGYIALWFNDKYQDHWLWFHEITNLANNDFVVACGGSCLHYKYRGIFSGVRGIDQELVVTEYPLQQDNLVGEPIGEPIASYVVKL